MFTSPGTWARAQNRNAPEPTDGLFPANHKRQFNKILKAEGLKFDRDGNRRTAYSLRHTYICFRLMEGADIYQIAKNCRTNVEMIFFRMIGTKVARMCSRTAVFPGRHREENQSRKQPSRKQDIQ